MVVVVVVDCRKFVVPLLVPHKSPARQKKVQLVEVYMSFVEHLLGPHKSLVDCKRFVERMLVPHSYLVEMIVADCTMFVELLLVIRTNLVELRKRPLVVSYKMFVGPQVVLHRSLVEHYNPIVVLLFAFVLPCKLVSAVVSVSASLGLLGPGKLVSNPGQKQAWEHRRSVEQFEEHHNLTVALILV